GRDSAVCTSAVAGVGGPSPAAESRLLLRSDFQRTDYARTALMRSIVQSDTLSLCDRTPYGDFRSSCWRSIWSAEASCNHGEHGGHGEKMVLLLPEPSACALFHGESSSGPAQPTASTTAN